LDGRLITSLHLKQKHSKLTTMKKHKKTNLIGEQRQDKPANPYQGELRYIKSSLTQNIELIKALVNKIDNLKKNIDNELK
jgi:hypothetical protein